MAVLLPQGLSSLGAETGSWNTGWSPNVAIMDPDDVGFIVACIDRFRDVLQQDYARAARLPPIGQVAVPTARPFRQVFGMGFSAGGSMLYRVAGEEPGLFDAIAVVSGASGGFRFARDAEDGRREVVWGPAPGPGVASVLHIHGSADPQVLIAGGRGPAKIVVLQPYGSMTALDYVPYTFSQDASLDLWLAPRGKTVQSVATLERTDEVAPGVRETEWSDQVVSTVGGQLQVFVSWRVRRLVHGGGHLWPRAADLGWDATPYVFSWFETLR